MNAYGNSKGAIAASGGLTMPNALDDKKKASLSSRLIVAAVLIAVFVPCLILGSYFWLAFVSVALIIGTYELLHCTKREYGWWVYLITYVFVLCNAYWFLLKGNYEANEGMDGFAFTLNPPGSGLSISVFVLALDLFAYFALAMFDKKIKADDVFYLFGMGLLFALGMQSMMVARFLPYGYFALEGAGFDYYGSAVFFIFVAMATIFNDTFAYFVGIFFGKHKMIPSVSPNKTWEGFFGGWLLGGGFTLAFALLSDYFGYPLLPNLTVFGEGSRWYLVVLLSFLLPLIGNLGDLSFSYIKRHFGTKDFGTILRAHGGILDRVDSFSFTMIFACLVAAVSASGWAIL